MASMNKNRGFTIPEVLVTFVILTLIAAAVTAAMKVGNASWRTNVTDVQLWQNLRQAMAWMDHELKQTGPSSLGASVPVNPQPDPVTYPDPDDDPAYDYGTYANISYQKVIGTTGGSKAWSPNVTQINLNGTDLERIEDTADPVVIAQNIQSVQVRRLYVTPDLVEVALVAQKNALGAQGRTMTATLAFKIQMRN